MIRELSKTEARGARTTGHNRWILGVSLTAAVVMMIITFLVYRF